MNNEDEKRKTVCGTPNYLAPEILNKTGHNFAVDIWSAGVIVYTLLVGKPAFETKSIQDTYKRIKTGQYSIPASISNEAKTLIQRMLRTDPKHRPKIDEVAKFPWFDLWTPRILPLAALTTEPRFEEEDEYEDEENIQPSKGQQHNYAGLQHVDRNVQNQANGMVTRRSGKNSVDVHQNLPTRRSARKLQANNNNQVLGQGQTTDKNLHSENPKLSVPYNDNRRLSIVRYRKENERDALQELLPNMLEHLKTFIKAKPHLNSKVYMDEAEHPEICPIFWISKWVDFQDKYGFGYTLSQGHWGVNFNDDARIVLNCNNNNLMYIDSDLTEFHYQKSLKDWPKTRDINKKIQLIDYIIRYMNKNLLTAGSDIDVQPGDDFARIPYLKKWLRIDQDLNDKVTVINEKSSRPKAPGQAASPTDVSDSSCLVFMLTNGTFQVNFLKTHVKIIICPLLKAVTFLNLGEHSNRTYSLEALAKYGCDSAPFDCIRYAYLAGRQLMSEVVEEQAINGPGVGQKEKNAGGQSGNIVSGSRRLGRVVE